MALARAAAREHGQLLWRQEERHNYEWVRISIMLLSHLSQFD